MPEIARSNCGLGWLEVRPTNSYFTILEHAKGAFVNIVTWASDAEEYSHNAQLVLGDFDLFVADIVNPEPVKVRRKKAKLDEEIEEMISRAQHNPNAIIYGTFHAYEKDDP